MNFKKTLLILLALFISLNFVFSQDSGNGGSELNQNSNTVVYATDSDNPERQFVITDNQNQITQPKKTNGAWIFIRMVLVLVFVVVCIFFVMNFMKRTVNGDGDTDDPYLRKVAQVTLAPGKTVQIVTVLDNCYVVGVGEDSVNLLGQITDKELISAMNLSADKAAKTKKARNFEEILSMFMPSKSTKQTSATQDNIYSEASQNVTDFVKAQRKRINKSKKEE